MKNLLPLVVFLALAFVAAAFGAFFPPGAWYAELSKPSWTPPNWLFGPVWTVLYIMIGIAGSRLWRVSRQTGATLATAALGAWGVQMILNALWSWIFFGLHKPGLAFLEISLLWIAIAGTIALAWRQDRVSSWLLVPYLLWVSFASALNFTLWQMNPSV